MGGLAPLWREDYPLSSFKPLLVLGVLTFLLSHLIARCMVRGARERAGLDTNAHRAGGA